MKVHQSAKEAVAAIQPGHRVFIHGAAATPNALIDALVSEANRLSNVEIVHLHTIGPAKYADPIYRSNFKVSAFFIGANMRAKLDPDQVDYLPCFLSEIPQLFRSNRLSLDVALIHVSPPVRLEFAGGPGTNVI